MKAERNKHATALRLVITALSERLGAEEWRKTAMVLVDAIAEIRRLETENAYLRQDRDYWQHKWGNGSA